MKCPICKKAVAPGGPFEPFCSDRCRLLDLANWATEKYGIPADADPETETEDDQSDKR
jgi:endogenous inhibitor of DNA gyrase (YacG/DUF329 family)